MRATRKRCGPRPPAVSPWTPARRRILERVERSRRYAAAIHFKTPWRSGRTPTRLDPVVFVLRLASLLLPRGVNTVRYFGVFAPASPLRSRVVPERAPGSPPQERWVPWASLILRVFGREADRCPSCGEKMTWQATILAPERAWEVLRWIGRYGDLVRDGPAVARS